jgi:cysteine desulfuration protein SufE
VREKKIRTREKRTINFLVESDSNFTGGILYLLLEIFNNQKYEDIIESDLFFIKEIGLINILGNQRSIGLANIVKHMKMIALMEKVRIRRGRKRLDQKNNEIYS